MRDVSILVVEDEPKLLNRLVSYLSIFCDVIYKANNGCEALAIYKKHEPSIILTDINMPKITGVEFVQEVRKVDKSTQIIVLSGHTDTENFLKVVPLNLVNYLVKPIQMEQLKETILQAIENIYQCNHILLNNGFIWNNDTKNLLINKTKINLTNYENSFVEILILRINQDVAYEEIHNHIYNIKEYSQDAIFTLVKKIRKKTTKDFIKSCFKYGYRIESE